MSTRVPVCTGLRRLAPLLVAIFVLAGTGAAHADIFHIEASERIRPTFVEGSARFGGLQPDYVITEDDPHLRVLLADAERIGRSAAPYWEKVRAVRALVAHAYPRKAYDDPRYRGLLATYRARGVPIPLGEYVRAGAGVCREHVLTLHIALQRAGIDNDAVYARVAQGEYREDHGFVVLRGEGAGWTVDSYNALFDGVRYDELERRGGIETPTARAPHRGRIERGERRIVRINPYPVVRGATAREHRSALTAMNAPPPFAARMRARAVSRGAGPLARSLARSAARVPARLRTTSSIRGATRR